MQTLAAGFVIEQKFKILSQLGMGGLGTVYKAEQTDLNRIVAIKVLHDNVMDGEEMMLRFEREAKVLANLKHRNIVDVFAFGSIGPHTPFMAMEFVNGKSLDQLLKSENEEFVWRRVVKIAVQICEGLSFAHSKGVIHRDIKPQNIMIEACADGDIVKVLDFGLSRVLSEKESVQHLTTTGALIGSVNYMSPELCLGRKADERSDIYALGCTLYECLSGKAAIDSANPISIMNRQINEMPKLLRDSGSLRAKKIPIELDLIIFKALQKDPEERFQNMQEFSAAFKAVLEGRTEDLDLKALEKKSAGSSRNKMLIPLLIGILLFSGIIAAALAGLLRKETASQNPVLSLRTKLQLKAEYYLKDGKKLKQDSHDREAEIDARRALITIAKPFPENLRSAQYATKDLSILMQAAEIVRMVKGPPGAVDSSAFDQLRDNNTQFLEKRQINEYYKAIAMCKPLYLNAQDSSGSLFFALKACLSEKNEEAIKDLLKQYEFCARDEDSGDEMMRKCYLEIGRAYLAAVQNDPAGVKAHRDKFAQLILAFKDSPKKSLDGYVEMGQLDLRIKNYKEAENELLQAFAFSSSMEASYRGQTNQVAVVLANLYKEQNQYDKLDALEKRTRKVEATAVNGADIMRAVLDQESKRLNR